MTTATVGRRFQIVIPKEERMRLNLTPLSKVSVEARRDCLVVYPMSFKLRGLGSDLRDGKDPVAYVRELREEWGARP